MLDLVGCMWTLRAFRSVDRGGVSGVPGCSTWRLLCSSFWGSILQSLSILNNKKVITIKELHRSLPVDLVLAY